MKLMFILELIGTVAFAISGSMVGVSKKMDIFGVCVLGVTTAVGGGIIRDIMIGLTPPTAFQNPIYVIVAIITSLIVFIPKVREEINENSFILIFIDALGLAIFTVSGVNTAALSYDNHFFQIFLGVLTGVGGGVLRDIFAIQLPTIFIKNIYALACVVGAVICSYLYGINPELGSTLGSISIVIIRALAAKYHWSLPNAK